MRVRLTALHTPPSPMNNPFASAFGPAAASAADTMTRVNATIRDAMASAGLDTSTGLMRQVAETIERSLSQRPGGAPPGAGGVDADVIDVAARVIDPEVAGLDTDAARAERAPTYREARFDTHHHNGQTGSLSYKLYVPATAAASPRQLVVMLHGCTQSAGDFAAGTGMNALADEHGFLVVYPEQDAAANASKCWNWFQEEDQSRNRGEPALIAGIVRDVAARHEVEGGRIYVAGFSAGAAMAVIMGETYPELFAAVGVHSGLPYASAHDIASAMAQMKGGRSGLPGLQGLVPSSRAAENAVPTIVFHGDRDHTVQVSNAEEIVRQATELPAHRKLARRTEEGVAAGGRRYTRTVHRDANQRARLESWTLHGAGHAWSGGDRRGSYTDPSGPDASAEMVRFFLSQRR